MNFMFKIFLFWSFSSTVNSNFNFYLSASETRRLLGKIVSITYENKIHYQTKALMLLF